MVLNKQEWSHNLKEIKPVVKDIFYKGNLSLLLDKGPKLAIVGSRHMTEYGSRVIEGWVPVLVNAGITIVSGFMYGVDQKAHQVCLENGGKTIAVLGWGIDWGVSENDIEMYDKILENDSLILSEYEGESKPERWKFPQRNRIVVGISDAVWVVEGAEKSGSLITAKMTCKANKKLFALPGQVTSKVASGTNNLIKNKMATMVTDPYDILSEFNLGEGQLKLDLRSSDIDPILGLLGDEPKTVDEVARVLRITVGEAIVRLSNLSLMGTIREQNGKFFIP